MPRSSAASFAGSPRASPTSARRRTRSSAPATPPRHAPVRRIRSTSSAACAPRRPWNASNLSSGATRPERTTSSPHVGPAVARRSCEPGGPERAAHGAGPPPALRGPPAARGRRRARRARGPARAPPPSPPSAGRASRAGNPRRARRGERRRTPLRRGPLPRARRPSPRRPTTAARRAAPIVAAGETRPEPQTGGEGEEDEVARMTAGGDEGGVQAPERRSRPRGGGARSHPHLLPQRRRGASPRSPGPRRAPRPTRSRRAGRGT